MPCPVPLEHCEPAAGVMLKVVCQETVHYGQMAAQVKGLQGLSYEPSREGGIDGETVGLLHH